EFQTANESTAACGGLSLDPAAHLSSRHLLRASAQIPRAISAAYAPKAPLLIGLSGSGTLHSQTGNFQQACLLILAPFPGRQHTVSPILRRCHSASNHGLSFPEAHTINPQPRLEIL